MPGEVMTTAGELGAGDPVVMAMRPGNEPVVRRVQEVSAEQVDHGEGPEAHVRITWQGLRAPELYRADHPFQLYVP